MAAAILIGFVAFILGGAVWLAQRLGRARAERDFHENATKRVNRAREIDEEISALGDRELDRRLRPFRRARMPMDRHDHSSAGGHFNGPNKTPDTVP